MVALLAIVKSYLRNVLMQNFSKCDIYLKITKECRIYNGKKLEWLSNSSPRINLLHLGIKETQVFRKLLPKSLPRFLVLDLALSVMGTKMMMINNTENTYFKLFFA